MRKKKLDKNAIEVNKLNTAIVLNDITAINEILNRNIDVNTRGSHGLYPIQVAVKYGNANALISLLRRGANPNTLFKRNGYSLLMEALSSKVIPNRYLIVVLLLKNGADVNIIGYDSKSALYIARTMRSQYIPLLKRFGAEY